MTVDNKTYLAAGVIFNRNIDPATVQQNVNIRLLMNIRSILCILTYGSLIGAITRFFIIY